MHRDIVKAVFQIVLIMDWFQYGTNLDVASDESISGIGYKMCERFCDLLSPRCYDPSYTLRDFSCKLIYSSEEQISLSSRNRCSRWCGPESSCIVNRKGRETCTVVYCLIDDIFPFGTFVPVGYIRASPAGHFVCRGNGTFSKIKQDEKSPYRITDGTSVVLEAQDYNSYNNGGLGGWEDEQYYAPVGPDSEL